MKILVVDDIYENRLLLDKLLSRMQHEVILVENGEQAVHALASVNPDLILMDIMMPVMDGLEAIKAIRERTLDKWVPIFVLSALADDQNVLDGLQAGADDYLQKPFSRAVLAAKLGSVQRVIDMQNLIIADTQLLKAYRDENEAEQQFLQSIFERLIKQSDLKDDHLQFWLLPAKRFSGDLICARRVSKQQIYFMLADSTGHGLAAALPTVIVNQAFQAMTKKGLAVPIIVREINRLVHSQMPTGRFVALVLGMIDAEKKSVELWNGGLPDVYALDGDGKPVHTFRSSHPSAGILDNRQFDDTCEIWHWREACELFMYSDGLTDTLDPDGALFGQERVLQILRTAPPGAEVAAIQQALEAHMLNREAQDDISCMAIRCR
ncbi:fused response regulator/phosphatase [Methylomonas sp. LW13]|uniref:PP2C family protein-serine/threonine phosphatase n=1 Tax=unclassified Methylomonas TaxID=2608980 RepID=UPI00051C49C2|nr:MULTISPECIES: SpoIIE family protein phosphatase [unclassified Methylomonas]PKD42296.1 fused response regulator/phosphatase [Methylomonas sp. Kb3]QBC25798.1 fused response regulator/phosphatase [Methylomonas sp. LW13]